MRNCTDNKEDKYKDWFREYKSKSFITIILLKYFFYNLKKIISKFDNDFKILEVGCGLGTSSIKIVSMLDDQHFEVSEYVDTFVKRLINSDFPFKVTQESVYNLKRKDNAFDCIIFLEVLEHLENVDRALEELFRVSKKYILISVPNEPIWRIANMMRFKYLRNFGNTPDHINHWSPKKLKDLISRYGKVEKMLKPFPWIIVIAKVK